MYVKGSKCIFIFLALLTMVIVVGCGNSSCSPSSNRADDVLSANEVSVEMKKCIILFPVEFNDGTEIPSELISQIMHEIDEVFNGHTVAGKVKGTYRMADGNMKSEPSSAIWIAVAPDKLNVLRRMLGRFARTLQQESIYFEVTDSKVEFIGPEKESGA